MSICRKGGGRERGRDGEVERERGRNGETREGNMGHGEDTGTERGGSEERRWRERDRESE